MSENNGQETPRCGTCGFWVKAPANRMNLADIRGDCRRLPPSVTLAFAMSQQGPQIVSQGCAYPSLPDNFPPCGEYRKALPIIEAAS